MYRGFLQGDIAAFSFFLFCSIQRPEGFLEGGVTAFLVTEKDAGKKLDKISEDNSELFDRALQDQRPG